MHNASTQDITKSLYCVFTVLEGFLITQMYIVHVPELQEQQQGDNILLIPKSVLTENPKKKNMFKFITLEYFLETYMYTMDETSATTCRRICLIKINVY